MISKGIFVWCHQFFYHTYHYHHYWRQQQRSSSSFHFILFCFLQWLLFWPSFCSKAKKTKRYVGDVITIVTYIDSCVFESNLPSRSWFEFIFHSFDSFNEEIQTFFWRNNEAKNEERTKEKETTMNICMTKKNQKKLGIDCFGWNIT